MILYDFFMIHGLAGKAIMKCKIITNIFQM